MSMILPEYRLARRRCAAALIVLSLSACSGGGTEPGPVGPPTAVVVSAGNQQVGQAGAVLTAPIAAKVTDAGGRGVPNIPVAFIVSVGTGSIETTSGRTNGAGIATATWRVGVLAGRQEQVVASVLDTLTGALVDTAIFVATVAAGPPASVFPIGGSGIVIAIGQTTPAILRALVRDAFGNRVSGATVSWIVAEGQATLAAATSLSNVVGEATNTLTPGQTAGDIVVRASVAGVPSPGSFNIQARNVSERVAFLTGGGFGIARTPAGQLVVTIIDGGRIERLSTANPPSSASTTVGGTPVVIAVDPAGQRAYAANMDGTLAVIDVASMALLAEVAIPGEAHSLAMSPRGNRVYVTNTSQSVFEVDVATRTIVRTIATGSGPWGITFRTTAADSLMYVTDRNGGSITEVDMRTGGVLRTIGVTGRPHGIAIAPNGSTLYVADDSNGEILFVDRVSGTTTRRISAPGAFGIAIAPDGNTLYVTTNLGYILVVDVASATVTKQVSTEGQPRQILSMPDGNSALAANMSGWIDLVRR